MLTEGLWVGPSPAGDNVFRLTLEGDRLTGHSYLVREGKAVSEAPVVSAKMEVIEGEADDAPGITVEIHLLPGWTYRGRLSADGNKLEGELDLGRNRRLELDLSHVGIHAVPAIFPRPPVPDGEPAYVYRRPPETGDGWETASAEAVGLELASIQDLVADVMAGKAGQIHSLLLVKGGKLVVEEYFHGFDREDLHALHSCTKSVASLLVGLAIQRGELAGVETPLLELFPELRPLAAAGWEGLLVEHLLTMTSGAEPPRSGMPPVGVALIRAALASPPASPVGTRWRYSDLDADLLGAVLHRATGVQADAYAERHLFGPLGILRWDWEMGKVDGFPRLYGTLRLRPRDMAKLGVLILNGGRWRGAQVVAEGWVQESIRQRVDTGGEGFGYMWWREPVPPSFPSEVISARGVGSQFIYVAPGLDLIAVVTGGNIFNGMGFSIGDVLARHLSPKVPPT